MGSATTLGPRSASAALDLAIASIHVRIGSEMSTGNSGVSSFTAEYIATHSAGQTCVLKEDEVDSYRTPPTLKKKGKSGKQGKKGKKGKKSRPTLKTGKKGGKANKSPTKR